MKSMAYRWGDITPGDTDSQTDSDEEQEDLFAGSGTYIEGQYIDPEGPLGREDDIETGIVQQEGPVGRRRRQFNSISLQQGLRSQRQQHRVL